MKNKKLPLIVGGALLLVVGSVASQMIGKVHAQSTTNQTNQPAQTGPKTTVEFQLAIEDLNMKIKQLKENQEREETYHKEFVDEKLALIRDFESENINMNSELLDTKNEIVVVSNEIREIELLLERDEQRKEIYKTRLLDYVTALKNSVRRGFPFDVKKRTSTVQAILDDLNAKRSTVIESFYRILKFLNDEETLAYDSQVIQNIEYINDEPVNATILRIGRFYLAVQANDEVYLYRKGPDNNYFIDSENPVGLFDKRNIENAILMVQGRQTPDLLELPVYPNLIRKK